MLRTKNTLYKWFLYLVCSPSIYFTNILQAFVYQQILDEATNNTFINEQLLIKVILIISMFVILAIMSSVANYTKECIVQNKLEKIKNKIIRGPLVNYRLTKHTSNASYLSMITTDLTVLENKFYLPCFVVIEKGILFVVSCAYIYCVHPQILILFLLVLIPTTIIPKVIFKKSNARNTAFLKSNEKMIEKVEDLLNARTIIKEFKVSNHFIRKTQEIFREYKNRIESVLRIQTMANGANEIVTTVAFLLAMIYTLYCYTKREISVGEVLAIIQLSNTVFWPIQTIVDNINKIISTQSTRNKLKDFTKELPFELTMENSNWEKISIDDCFLHYDDKVVIKGCNIKINRNDKILLQGENGAGKSSFIKSLVDYISVDEIKIRIDNDESKKISDIAIYVEQNCILLNESIRENICLGENYDDMLIEKIIDDVDLNYLIVEKGFDYECGYHGDNLSGGEKQKIQLARALIRESDFLILDEPFSSIDKSSRVKIYENLFRRNNLTVVCVSHVDESEISHYTNKTWKIHSKIVQET